MCAEGGGYYRNTTTDVLGLGYRTIYPTMYSLAAVWRTHTAPLVRCLNPETHRRRINRLRAERAVRRRA